MLPTGYVYGGLTPQTAREALASAGRDEVALADLRGCSAWTAVGQLADIAVRRATGEARAATLRVTGTRQIGADWRVVIEHVDGRQWQVTVGPASLQALRVAGCGRAPTASTELRVVGLCQVRDAMAAHPARAA